MPSLFDIPVVDTGWDGVGGTDKNNGGSFLQRKNLRRASGQVRVFNVHIQSKLL